MVNRRRFLSSLAGAIVAPNLVWGRGGSGALTVYASVGPDLVSYEGDVEKYTILKRGSVRLPANVQYAWPHASRSHMYVASSDGGPGLAGTRHHATALRIDATTGALTPHGEPVALPSRPIHITTDIPSAHVLIAYNNPSALTVHRVRPDLTLGELVKQRVALDTGIYAHQIRVAPSNRTAILVTRGNDADGTKPEDPGALKVYGFEHGQLVPRDSVAPGGGYGFGPRHLDFHPTRPWVYVSRERENQIDMFVLEAGTLTKTPRFSKTTLADLNSVRARQVAGTVHVHPSGRVVYVANRASSTTDFGGKRVFSGGENNIAVYAIDPRTGEPRLIQHADTRGFHARTFHIDPTGRMLVAAHILPLDVRDGATVTTVPPCLSVFRVDKDGRLDFVRKYDVDVGGSSMFWMGMIA